MKPFWLDSWTDPTDHGRITLVFQNRNLAYGAFDLRKRYSSSLVRSLLITSLFLTGLFIVPYLRQLVSVELPDLGFENTVIDLTPPPSTAPAAPEEPKPDPVKKTLAAAISPISTIIGDHQDKDLDSLLQDDKDLASIVNSPVLPGGDGAVPGTGTGNGPSTDPSADVTGGSTETIPVIVEEMPEFHGGFAAMYEYLGLATHYPEGARKDQVGARLFVGFIVEKDGTLSDVKILNCNQTGYGFEEETLRVIRSMPAWKPGRQNGHAVRVRYNIPFQFKSY